MPRMYHPDLPTGPDYNPVDVTDEQAAVMKESGWGTVIPPEAQEPSAFAAEQPDATYVLKNPEAEKTRPAASATRAEWEEYVSQLGGDTEGLTKAELAAKADELEATDQ
jgi:hypothetical protein